MNQNDEKATALSQLCRLSIAFFAGPLLIAYGLLLAFLVVNGVSGSSKWLSDHWKKFESIKGLFLTILGTAAWVWGIARLT